MSNVGFEEKKRKKIPCVCAQCEKNPWGVEGYLMYTFNGG